MGTRKKGSELVFNLQWKNKPDNGGDKSNVIGMYDTPTTTSNFEMFKSYLLKNSGVAGNDVKVTYITDCGQEWVIDSQEWFEIALSAFRLKARLGEVIFLKLDKISNGRHQITRKHSNDVETQFDVDSISNNEVTPPDWFITYMKQFKRDIVEEVTFAVSSNVSTPKEKEGIPIIITKRTKPDVSKRSRKHLGLGETPIDKDLLKTLKYDRKLENKLDKLDAKTKKIKEKKQALMNKIESEETRFFKNVSFAPFYEPTNDITEENPECVKTKTNPDAESAPVPVKVEDVKLLNGTAVNATTYQRMVGGEVYLQTWELINNGKLAWSRNTELRLTWGSSKLVPSVKSLQCPPLKPGKKVTVSVRFEIPVLAGTYESYWNFYDANVRFGQALICCFIVEESLKIINQPQLLFNQSTSTLKTEEKDKDVTESISNTREDKGTSNIEEATFSEVASTSAGKVIVVGNSKFTERTADSSVPVMPQLFKFAPEQTDKEINENKEKDSEMKDDFLEPDKLASYISNTMFHPYRYQANDVMDLSRKMKDIKIVGHPNVDSDSDWESMCSFEKQKLAEENLANGLQNQPTNKYGITENDLIVDLSVNSKENESVVEHVKSEEDKNISKNEDNNNNGVYIDNSCAGSCSEFSDVGYTYEEEIQDIVCDDKEDDDISGYVYITIDGNKLSVPRHILRPDFLQTAEKAPGPIFSDDEKSLERKKCSMGSSSGQGSSFEKLDMQTVEPQQQNEDANVLDCCPVAQPQDTCQVTEAPVPESTISESAASNRLFIFPQNNPGYEVFCSNHSPCVNVGKDDPNEHTQTYTWAKSPTQYTLSDVHNIKRTNPMYLRSNPYGPLDQSRHSTPTSEKQGPTSPPIAPTCPFATCQPTGQYTQYSHVPNYQQAGANPLIYPQMAEAASAPQQPNNGDHNVPVHILPENLVSGAVNVASSAINTARSVINMIVPPRTEPGKWVGGHWVTENPESLRAKNLCVLAEMGFWDTDLNATLLARYNDDINRVINELIQ